jgi:hypothetical protein
VRGRGGDEARFRRRRPGIRRGLRSGRSPIASDPTMKNGAAPQQRPAPGSRGDDS